MSKQMDKVKRKQGNKLYSEGLERVAENNMPLSQWPPRSPGLTLGDFFQWGYVKDKVFISPLPVDLTGLKQLTSDPLSMDLIQIP
ncbi:hypothetical protein TNCV_357361 [Trichonephila clavipes]|nr:hypothetical protein TNCV_357361 [Trichonephila clavipes]